MVDLIIKNAKMVLENGLFHGNIQIKDGKNFQLSETNDHNVSIKEPVDATINTDREDE